MKTHTPGPWSVYQPESIDTCYEGEDNPATIRAGGTHVATIPGMRPQLSKRSLANAHLIASAPDLLAALSGIFDHAERTDAADLAEIWSRMDDIRNLARAAISKATGGAA